MRSLLNFLLRHKTLILFLFMEGLALFMLSSSHNYHQTVVSNTARSISGGLTGKVEKGRSYFRLREVNEGLVRENLMLRKRLESLKTDAATSFITISDTVNKLK